MKSAPKTGLIDRIGREITYLRVSLTDRCNLRCQYCYGSADCLDDIPALLTNEQLVRLIRTFAALGVNKIRFTGGEPLIYPGLVDVIRKTSSIEGISRIGITTNGLLLESKLPSLIEAGLNGLNISLDSFKRDRFKEITGVDGFERTYKGIMSAVKTGVFPMVKVNTVVMRGVNDDEIPQFTEWALSHRIDIRFIEFMPTEQAGWGEERFISENEMKERIKFTLRPLAESDFSKGPAKTYVSPGHPGRISFISAVSHSFCHECNRLRLTASGDIIGCLFGARKVNVRGLLDKNIEDEELSSLIKSTIAGPDFRRLPTSTSIGKFQPHMRRIGG
jgi:cyclic pyranopterin phosphate synthase